MKVMKGGNMKNVIKKLAGLLMVLSVALFAGCSDSSDRANEAPQTAKTYTVSGKISIGNAVPANVAKSLASASEGASSNARTATTDFDMNKITCGTTIWEVKATNASGEIYGEVDSVEMLYSINLPTGTWDLELSLLGEFDTNTFEALLYYEEKELEVPGDSGTGPDIFLSPKNFSTNINGALDLTITDDTEEHKIKSVICSLEYLTREDSADFPMDENFKKKLATVIASLKEPKKFSSGEVKEVKIECNDIPAGCYEATFTFKDENDNTLYECKEIITVFSGWTTDTWLGEGAHLKKNTEGKIEFRIEDIFEVENVPDTQMALFNVHTERDEYENLTFSGYKYYFSADGDDIDENTEENIKASNNSINSFVFDNNGYFYTLHTTSSGGDTSYYINTNNDKVADRQVEIPASYNPSRLAYDSKTDIIYLVSINEAAMYLYQLPKLASEGTLSELKQVYFSGYYEQGVDEFSSCHYKMCIVHDDVVYSIVRGDYDSKGVRPALVISKVSENDTNKPAASGVQILSTDMKNANDKYGDITDLLYQDGAVYMLYRDVSDTSSRGALIRYDVKFGGIKVLGFTNNKLEKEDFTTLKIGVYDGVYSVLSRDTNEPIVFPGSHSWQYTYNETETDATLKDYIIPLITTAPLSATPDLTVKGFFGPVKFIAIKPKKLIIADDGIAFYTDNDLLKYKNVNRIVTVDLESFSIIDTPLPLVNVHFNGDDSDVKSVLLADSGTTSPQDTAVRAGINAMLPDPGSDGNGITLYYKNSNGENVNNLSSVTFGIPCGDSE